MTLDLTADKQRALHDLLAYVLRARRVMEDEDAQSLVSVMRKLRKEANLAFCCECAAPEVYAKGRCQACYRRRLRAG